MLGVLAKVAQLTAEHGGAAARVHHPASACGFFAGIARERNRLRLAGVQIETNHLGRAPQIAARCHRHIQHVTVERRAIHLKGREPRLITRAHFHAIVERLVGAIREPHAQALFHQLVMAEVRAQAENSRQVTAADLGRRFAYFAIELGRLFDQEDACGGMLALQDQRGGRAGKSAADNDDIIIKLHRSEDDGGAGETQSAVRRSRVRALIGLRFSGGLGL